MRWAIVILLRTFGCEVGKNHGFVPVYRREDSVYLLERKDLQNFVKLIAFRNTDRVVTVT